MQESISAPVNSGDPCGKIIYYLNGEAIAEKNVYCASDVAKISFWTYMERILKKIF